LLEPQVRWEQLGWEQAEPCKTENQGFDHTLKQVTCHIKQST